MDRTLGAALVGAGLAAAAVDALDVVVVRQIVQGCSWGTGAPFNWADAGIEISAGAAVLAGGILIAKSVDHDVSWWPVVGAVGLGGLISWGVNFAYNQTHPCQTSSTFQTDVAPVLSLPHIESVPYTQTAVGII